MRTTLSLGAKIVALAVATVAFATSAEARHRHHGSRHQAPAAQTACTFFCPQVQSPAQARQAAVEARRQAVNEARAARQATRQQARESRLSKFRSAHATVSPTEMISAGGSQLVDGGGRRYASRNATVTGGRPSGCPHAFCGCQASLEVFGKIIPTLNLAYNWVTHFNRTSPAPGMVAARSGHVFVLRTHVAGDVWEVKDGNSGGHMTRIHERSIRGYVIVDPHSPRTRLALN
jgi:hypothetical protein